MMNEPKRLREVGAPGLRALVEAGQRDVPPAELQDTVLDALGLGAAIVAGSSAHGAAWRVVARFSAGLRHAAVSKIGIGLFAMTAAGSTFYFAGRASEHEHPTLSKAAAPSAGVAATPLAPFSALSSLTTAAAPGRTLVAALASSGVDSAPAAPSHPPMPVAVSSPPALAPQPPSPVKVASPRSAAAVDRAAFGAAVAVAQAAQAAPTSIAVELESIRHVRALVEKGDSKAALAALDAYEARNPRGTFEEEATALRVRALRAVGDEAGAERERASLAARFPRSVHLAALGK
ncbi:MAG: hypothetical protein ABSF69_29210 [Polyangiaceae bacterium]|jgi:hypothetical protein